MKNMIEPRLLFLPLLLFAISAAAQDNIQEVSMSFKCAGQKIPAGEEADLKSDDGKLRIMLKSGEEVKDAPGGRKAIYCSGMQSAASQISRCLSPCPPIEFSLKVYPQNMGDKEQIILAFGVFDLRYHCEKQEISVLVSLEDGPFSVKAPCPEEKWSSIGVKITETSVSLTVNGTETVEKIPEGKKFKKVQMYPRVGGSTARGWMYRGYLDELIIKMKTYPIEKK